MIIAHQAEPVSFGDRHEACERRFVGTSPASKTAALWNMWSRFAFRRSAALTCRIGCRARVLAAEALEAVLLCCLLELLL